MFGFGRSNARRAEIRRNRPSELPLMARLRAEGGLLSLAIAAAFCAGAAAILVMREDVVRYRPGQWVHHDIVARVDFAYRDERLLAAQHERAREDQPRIYKLAQADPWKVIEDELLALPERVKGQSLADLPFELAAILDAASLAKLQEYESLSQRPVYEESVHKYVEAVRKLGMTIIPDDQRKQDLTRQIVVAGVDGVAMSMKAEQTITRKMRDPLANKISPLTQQNNFTLVLQPKVLALTLAKLGETHVVDDVATAAARENASRLVDSSPNAGTVVKARNMPIIQVREGGDQITQEDWQMLKAENEEYLRSLGIARWGHRVGLGCVVVLMTIIASAYIARYQPRIVRNQARAAAISVLMLSMLLVALLAGLGPSSIYVFGIAPTLLVAMILTIAYDQRFALGMATFHAVLVTLAINADLSFLVILESGVVTCCFALDDLRTRSKLIEVGGVTSIVLILATGITGLLAFDPIRTVVQQSLYSGAAGLAIGFIVLGVLPFIEKAFRITTSMTLLELADASQPLLRRLSLEAPGTYNHSLQVATLSEEAADAIGANSLLCRVGAYYHDIGKINKADYFVENQVDGHNRHLNLSPNVSLLIILGHVKDGVELAREYNLPTSLFPFIQQHHGTTLVEYFYHRACDTATPDQPDVSDSQYRYPGPKPKSREIAILMIADAVESATRAMPEPNASRIEALVHDLTMRRLNDGQFDECDLTMRDLDGIQRSLTKTLLGIYHGRIAYPSTSAHQAAPARPAPEIKTA